MEICQVRKIKINEREAKDKYSKIETDFNSVNA